MEIELGKCDRPCNCFYGNGDRPLFCCRIFKLQRLAVCILSVVQPAMVDLQTTFSRIGCPRLSIILYVS